MNDEFKQFCKDTGKEPNESSFLEFQEWEIKWKELNDCLGEDVDLSDSEIDELVKLFSK